MQIFKYKILKDQKLIIRYVKGEVSIQDFFAFIKNSADDPDYDSSFSVLYDIREATMCTDYDCISNFAENVRSTKKLLNKRKLVFLTSKPHQVVFAQIAENFRKLSLFDTKTVSTEEAALRYLEIQESSFEEIKSTIISLLE